MISLCGFVYVMSRAYDAIVASNAHEKHQCHRYCTDASYPDLAEP